MFYSTYIIESILIRYARIVAFFRDSGPGRSDIVKQQIHNGVPWPVNPAGLVGPI